MHHLLISAKDNKWQQRQHSSEELHLYRGRAWGQRYHTSSVCVMFVVISCLERDPILTCARLAAAANRIRVCDVCRQTLTDTYMIPELWWSDHQRNSNGYFGCEKDEDAAGVPGLSTYCLTRVLVSHSQSRHMGIFRGQADTGRQTI